MIANIRPYAIADELINFKAIIMFICPEQGTNAAIAVTYMIPV